MVTLARNWRYLIGCFVFLQGISGGANELDLETLKNRLESTLRYHAPPCPVDLDPTLTQTLFVFEGSGGYAPVRGFLDLPYLHREGRLRSDLEEKSKTSEPHALFLQKLRKIEEQKESERNGEMIAGFRLASQELEKRGEIYASRILYYDFTAVQKAVACASGIHALYEQAGLPHSLSLVGFSMGGFAAIRFAKSLERIGIELDRVLTLDPVPYSLEVAFSLGYFSTPASLPIPKNYRIWSNQYQWLDRGTLRWRWDILPPIPIRGSRLRGIENVWANNGGKLVDRHMEVVESQSAQGELLKLIRGGSVVGDEPQVSLK